jgi:hypothetical protein
VKNIISVILILIFLHPSVDFSQEKITSSGNDIGFSIGLEEHQVKEKILNNIRHQGLFPSLGFYCERTRDASKQKSELNLNFNLLKSRYDPESASIVINPSISYRHARMIKNITPDIRLYLGGIAGFSSHSAYYANWDDSHIYWLSAYSLGLDCIFIYQKSNKSSLLLEINTPFIALVSRPPERFLYKVLNPEFSWLIAEFHDNMRLTSIHQHLALNIDLAYKFRYSKKFEQRLFWHFSYLNNSMSYSKDISILTHTFGVTFLF